MPHTESLRRPLIVGTRGAVSTCHPLATSAGLEILWRGGNAFDAAVAVAAALGVVEPLSCGAGGDVFALCYDARRNETTALNAAGAAPLGAHAREYASGGIPVHGIRSATVPAAVDGWLAVLERYGTLPAADVFAPAIAYAEEGYPAGLYDVHAIDHYEPLLAADPEAAAVFLPDGRPLGLGDRIVQRDLAATLREIARGGRDAFYAGTFADGLLRRSREAGGLFTQADLAPAHASWHDPVVTDYRGYTVYAQPPVSHGFILLEALNMLEAFDLHAFGRNTARLAHCMIEIKKLVFADRHAYVGDPEQVAIPLDTLLSKALRGPAPRGALDLTRAAMEVPPGPVPAAAGGSDTTYFAVGDRAGNLVSFMQSLYRGFGSGVIVPGTGVLLNNRLGGFSLDPQLPERAQAGPGAGAQHGAQSRREGRPCVLRAGDAGRVQPGAVEHAGAHQRARFRHERPGGDRGPAVGARRIDGGRAGRRGDGRPVDAGGRAPRPRGARASPHGARPGAAAAPRQDERVHDLARRGCPDRPRAGRHLRGRRSPLGGAGGGLVARYSEAQARMGTRGARPRAAEETVFIAAEVDVYDDAASVEATIANDLAHPRRSLGPTRAAPPSRKAARDSRAPGCSLPPGHGRRLVRAPHGLPMEGVTPGIWVRLHMPPSLPGMGRSRRLRAVVGYTADPVRRPPRDPVALAIRWTV